MANNSNPVFNTLITYGNQNVLPAGNQLSSLVPGQIGVFDADTHLSIDGSAPVKKFYIAVGYDMDGDGVTDHIEKSAGDWIDPRKVHCWERRDYQAGQPMEIEISGIQAACDKIYTLKVTFFNDMIYKRQGYNFYTKTYSVRTGCCGACADCTSADCNELVKLLLEAINNDPDGMLEAYAVDSANNIITDIDTFIATNSATNTDSDPTNDVCAKLRIRTKPIKNSNSCGIPFKYYNPLETKIEASLLDSLQCVATSTIIQPLIYEQGNGTYVRRREYIAGGWSGNPNTYRLTNDYGILGQEFHFHSDINTNYDSLTICYSNSYAVGWQDFDHNLQTEIYIPQPDDATMNTLRTVLNNLFDQFGFPNQ